MLGKMFPYTSYDIVMLNSYNTADKCWLPMPSGFQKVWKDIEDNTAAFLYRAVRESLLQVL